MFKSFSLLEFILVLLILSLILSLARFYPQNDKLLLGAKQIVNDIAYTKNLALVQNSFRTDIAKDEWYKSRWQLYFIRSKSATNNEQTYTIFLDKNGDGNANIGKSDINVDREIALDIINPNKLMNSGQSGVISKDDLKASKRFNIEQRFGINKVEFKGSCTGTTRIIFDEFARLHSPLKSTFRPYEKNLAKTRENCIIKLTNTLGKNVCIVIDPLSGYAYIPEFQGKNIQNIHFKNKLSLCSKI